MIVFDSSAWIELLMDGPKAAEIEPFLKPPWIVPEITLAEIAARFHAVGRRDVTVALKSIIKDAHVAGINIEIAERTGFLRNQFKKDGLSVNDAVIWATAEYYDAKLLTLDHDFKPFKNAIVL